MGNTQKFDLFRLCPQFSGIILFAPLRRTCHIFHNDLQIQTFLQIEIVLGVKSFGFQLAMFARITQRLFLEINSLQYFSKIPAKF